MAKKVKYLIKDESTLILKENASEGDIIDLTEETDLDTKSVIRNFDVKLNNLAQQKAQELAKIEILKATNDKDKTIADLRTEIVLLKKDIKTNDQSIQNKIDTAVLKAEAKKNELINSLKETINSQENDIKNLEYRWDHRNPSTKAMGEELEKFVWEQFESAQQNGAFPNAKFWKDNEVITSGEGLKGSKGDFIFKDYDNNGTEILSVEIEVKTQNNTTESKKKNKDHYQKLDNDRNNKKCEYALLVSELEKDNRNFDGIYKVHSYDKMYVVRPQTFVSFINVLKDSLKKNSELIQLINQKKSESIDQETFMANLTAAKDDFAISATRSMKNFEGAIESIDKSIKNLQEIRDKLTKSGEQLLTANNKLQGITIRKLKKGCKEDPFKK